MFKQGAEAKLFIGKFENKECIVKERFSKQYRHPILDKFLIKKRIRAEEKALKKSKEYGVKTPTVYSVDFNQKSIFMEYFSNAITVKEYLIKNNNNHTEIENKLCKIIGTCIGRLHKNNMIHGDLTTSNILINEADFELILIDFGLSCFQSSNEDKAVDLYVLERALISTHENAKNLFQIILKAYEIEIGSDIVLKKLQEVQARGRKRILIG